MYIIFSGSLSMMIFEFAWLTLFGFWNVADEGHSDPCLRPGQAWSAQSPGPPHLPYLYLAMQEWSFPLSDTQSDLDQRSSGTSRQYLCESNKFYVQFSYLRNGLEQTWTQIVLEIYIIMTARYRKFSRTIAVTVTLDIYCLNCYRY